MRKLFQHFLLLFSFVLKPVLEKRAVALMTWRRDLGLISITGMVSRFNFFHALLFRGFFRKVETLNEDIDSIRGLCERGPVVFVMKNRGQLEYRYFNHLFIKHKLPLISYANNVLTLFWWPLREIVRLIVLRPILKIRQASTLESSSSIKAIAYNLKSIL